MGITCGGDKDVLGLWIEQSEGAKFWLRIMNELKARGAQDVLIAVVDGLKGFPDATYVQQRIYRCQQRLSQNTLGDNGGREKSAKGGRRRQG